MKELNKFILEASASSTKFEYLEEWVKKNANMLDQFCAFYNFDFNSKKDIKKLTNYAAWEKEKSAINAKAADLALKAFDWLVKQGAELDKSSLLYVDCAPYHSLGLFFNGDLSNELKKVASKLDHGEKDIMIFNYEDFWGKNENYDKCTRVFVTYKAIDVEEPGFNGSTHSKLEFK